MTGDTGRQEGVAMKRHVMVALVTVLASVAGATAAAAGVGGAQDQTVQQQAAVPRGADADLRGLAQLGVVVESLGAQAAACGLDQAAIEQSVSKSLQDAGLKVARNSDEDTYVYVQINTSSLSPGVCVSRYDVFLYSYTMATLSYQSVQQLLQVSLLHKGGLAGGAPAAHAKAVTDSVRKFAEEIGARIRNAQKQGSL